MKQTISIFLILLALVPISSYAQSRTSHIDVRCVDQIHNPRLEVTIQRGLMGYPIDNRQLMVVYLFNKLVTVRPIQKIQKNTNRVFISTVTYVNSNKAPSALTLDLSNPIGSKAIGSFFESSYLPDVWNKIPKNIKTWELICQRTSI
jgi:hypothetical protein